MDSNNQKLEELLRQMYAEREPLQNASDAQLEQTIDEEWRKFEAQHFVPRHRWSAWPKIAAMFVGVLMLSGIAFAAVHIVRSSIEKDAQPQTEAARMETSRQQASQKAQKDSTQIQPLVFEDAELEYILSEIAAYYHVEVNYQNKDAKHIRLYFTWDMQQGIDDIIETFNRFERIHIERENRILTVK